MLKKISDRRTFTLLSTLLTILIGTLFYIIVEGWGFIDSFYFTVVTLTTVGYGDMYPVTNIGKVFTAFYILIGIGIIAMFIGDFVGSILDQRYKQLTNKYIKSKQNKPNKNK